MFVSGYLQCPPAASAMSSELLVDLTEDPATAQLGQLKLATIEDQQWPADESPLSKSGKGFTTSLIAIIILVYLALITKHSDSDIVALYVIKTILSHFYKKLTLFSVCLFASIIIMFCKTAAWLLGRTLRWSFLRFLLHVFTFSMCVFQRQTSLRAMTLAPPICPGITPSMTLPDIRSLKLQVSLLVPITSQW